MDEDWTFATVLDHGFVKLHDAMPHWTRESGDARVVEAARVSFARGVTESETRTTEQNEKLIRYLLKNAHTSPFEKVRFEFVAKMPIFVARQWVRHRTGSINEVSARYTELPNEYYLPALERVQEQSASNKQGSGAVFPEGPAQEIREEIAAVAETAYEAYERLLNQNVARELARMVLPTNFYTAWYWTVDLHNLMGFFRTRLHPHAQFELRQYAKAMISMAAVVAPMTMRCFTELYGKDLDLPGIAGELPGPFRDVVLT